MKKENEQVETGEVNEQMLPIKISNRVFFDEKINPIMRGTFVGIEQSQGIYGGTVLVFNDLKEEKQILLPLYSILEDIKFIEGRKYHISYMGTKKTEKGTEYHLFNVYLLS